MSITGGRVVFLPCAWVGKSLVGQWWRLLNDLEKEANR